MQSPPSASPPAPHPLEYLVELVRRARRAEDATTLRFIAVNDSHLLAPYQQSCLWSSENGIEALSGVVEVDANVPYVQFLQRVCEPAGRRARVLTPADLPAEVAVEWEAWLPFHAVWIPFAIGKVQGGALFVRELPWRELELKLLSEWLETWSCLYAARQRSTFWRTVRGVLRRAPAGIRRRPLIWAATLLVMLALPVRISVLVPGELVPANPVTIRAPLDGIIKTFHVQANQTVRAGDPLISYDEAAIASRLEVALEALRTAEAEQRQYTQQALFDPKARAALAAARGNVEERRIEMDYLKTQVQRNTVAAPCDGMVFVDDASEWVGRPVVAGQRIMRLAVPGDKEIEAWLPVADAIELPTGGSVRLYLDSSPLSPVSGMIRYVAFESVLRPDNHYAYRVRAQLEGPSEHRIGLKGTVRLNGRRVPLIYWMLRRPFAALRGLIGI